MTKKNPVYLTVLLVALAIVITFQTTFILTEGYKKDTPADTAGDGSQTQIISAETYTKLQEIAAYYAAYFPDDIDSEEVENYLISALIAGAGDTFGNYVSAEGLEEYISNISGSYKGIGVSVIYNSEHGVIEVVSVFPDSPAEKAGVLPGDLVT